MKETPSFTATSGASGSADIRVIPWTTAGRTALRNIEAFFIGALQDVGEPYIALIPDLKLKGAKGD